MTKLHHEDNKEERAELCESKKPGRKEEEEEGEEKVKRGVQGSATCRGEGEGRVRMMEGRERGGEIIGSHREAGVGEEVLHVQVDSGEPCGEVKSKKRGEAEGGQKDHGKQEKEGGKEEQTAEATSSESQSSVEESPASPAPHQAVRSLSVPDVELLTKRLQEAQDEADSQATVAQDLRSKLGEQSKKSWEAEQRLVVLEAELQHLRKTAESLGEARRQIEVWMDGWMQTNGDCVTIFN